MTPQKVIRVLLIENDPGDEFPIRRYLGSEGSEPSAFHLQCAKSLEEGIQLLEKEIIDVILLDLSLPDSEGLETLVHLRKQAGDVPLVVLTGFDDQKIALEAMANGAQDYLVKGSIDKRLLIRAISYAIERSRLLIGLRSSQEERLRAEIVERKRLDRLKDEFVSTVSHEIRTPLAIVKGAIKNLKDGILGTVPDKQVRVIEIADRNIDRLERIIRDLLDLSRLESGKTRINRHWIKLTELVSEMVQNFQMQAKERHITLHTELPPKISDLYLDGDMVAQVMTNLLSNAIRFAKGHVIVKVETLPLEALPALGLVDETPEGLEKKGETVQVSVVDDGPGIPSEAAEKLFNKFEQLHRPVGGAGYKGTGLGLAICREIVQLHHGIIWAENLPEQGAAFHFVLPPWGEDADFWVALKKSIVSAAEKKRPLALLVVISPTGVLDRALEETLRHKVLRKIDSLYHYPSRGISLILAETDSSGADSIRARVLEMKANHKLRIGFSIYPDDAADPNRLLNLAVQEAGKT